MSFKKIDAKNKIFIVGGIIIILFVIIIAIASLFSKSNMSFEQMELKLKSAAESYYADRTDALPKEDGEKVVISIDKLVEAKKIKPLNKLNKNEVCTGEVTVMNNNGYYLYVPTLDCGKNYHTETISSKIKSLNNVVTEGNGLYQIDNDYVFRGEMVNNYVSFANKTWRILRINEDNTIRIIHFEKTDKIVWDNRYNSMTETTDGINNYLVSRIRDKVNGTYNSEKFFTDEQRSYIVSHDVCVGKRTNNSDNAVECSNVLEKQPMSLLRVSEFITASIDPQCKFTNDMNCMNYNWIKGFPNEFWTVTADSTNTNHAYIVNGTAYTKKTNKYASLNVVLHLSGDLEYSGGDGSEANPYIIK